MLVQVLYRQAGSPAVKDADSTLWYGAALKWAKDNGLSDGSNMNGNVSREQLVTLLYRYAQLLKLGLGRSAAYDTYKDAAKVDTWAADAMSRRKEVLARQVLWAATRSGANSTIIGCLPWRIIS